MSDQPHLPDRDAEDLAAMGGEHSAELEPLRQRLITDGLLWQIHLPDVERVAERLRAIPGQMTRGGHPMSHPTDARPPQASPRPADPSPNPNPGSRVLGVIAAVVVVALLAGIIAHLAGSNGGQPTPAATPTPSPTVTPLPSPTAPPPSPVPTQPTVAGVAVPGAVGVVAVSEGQHANTLLLTTDGGAHWRAVTLSDGLQCDSVAATFLDANNGWAACGRSSPSPVLLLHTADGGQSWQSTEMQMTISNAGPDGTVSIFFLDARHGWVLARASSGSSSTVAGYLYATTDGGATWTEYTAPGDQGLIFSSPTNGFVVGRASGPGAAYQLSHTEDGGQTWERMRFQDNSHVVNEQQLMSAPVFFDALHGVVPVLTPDSGELVYATHDDGQQWTLTHQFTQSSQALATPMATAWGTHDAWIRFRNDNTYYRTSDAGQSWQRFTPDSGLPDFSQWQFASAQVGWALVPFPYPHIVQTHDGGTHWVNVYNA
ncbi:MAG TPA: YCF48-related protein [Ktedonobacterales bacterium]